MNKVQELKETIDKLSARERAELNALLHEWFDDDWDRQMTADAAPGGKLDRLKHMAEAEGETGALQDFSSPGRA